MLQGGIVRETIVDIVVFKYVFGAFLVAALLVVGGGLGIYHAVAERRRTNRALKEIMEEEE